MIHFQVLAKFVSSDRLNRPVDSTESRKLVCSYQRLALRNAGHSLSVESEPPSSSFYLPVLIRPALGLH